MRIVIYITEKLHHYCIFYVFFHFMCFLPNTVCHWWLTEAHRFDGEDVDWDW